MSERRLSIIAGSEALLPGAKQTLRQWSIIAGRSIPAGFELSTKQKAKLPATHDLDAPKWQHTKSCVLQIHVLKRVRYFSTVPGN